MTTDLQDLLKQAQASTVAAETVPSGDETSETTAVEAASPDESPAEEPVAQEQSPAPDIETAPDAEPVPDELEEDMVAFYSKVTIGGLQQHRPDIVDALKIKVKPIKTQRSKPTSKNPVDDYQAYRAVCQTMMEENPESVSGRRRTNLAKKFTKAMESVESPIPDGLEVEFLFVGGSFVPNFVGEVPSPEVPEELQ